MNIPFLKFSAYSSIPLTPEYILKIKEAMDASSNREPEIVINLSDNIEAKLCRKNNIFYVDIFEYDCIPAYKVAYRFGKIDSYTEDTLHAGSCFTDLFQGPFKSYILLEDKVHLVEEGSYILSHLNGIHKYYFNDVIETSTYVNDIKHGEYKVEGADGKLILQGAYTNGIKDGTWSLYYPNGIIKKIVNYSYLVGGLYGLTQTFDDKGSLLLSYGNILEALHGEYVDRSRNVTKYYIMGVEVDKEIHDMYDYKKQDEMFSMINRSYLAKGV